MISKMFASIFQTTVKLTLRVIDQRRKTILHLWEHTAEVNSVCWSMNGTRIVSGSDDMTIRVWDARTGEKTMKHYVRSVGFSSDGTRIVSGSNDKTVGVWSARTG